MNKTDMAFFETYKKLDRLCSDMFGLKNGGVTRYIDELKAIGYEYTDDCKILKRLRYIRNMLAHDEGTFDCEMCTKDDIAWLENFYDRLMRRTDPLAVYYSNSRKTHNTRRNNVQQGSNTLRKLHNGIIIFKIVFLLLTLACICYMYFLKFN